MSTNWYDCYITKESLSLWDMSPDVYQQLSESEKCQLLPREPIDRDFTVKLFKKIFYLEGLSIEKEREKSHHYYCPCEQLPCNLQIGESVIHIRFGIVEDVSQLTYWLDRLFWKFDRTWFLKQLLEYPQYCLIATCDNKICGALLMNKQRYIEFVFVVPNFQGNGIARKLLSTLIRLFGNLDISLHVHATNMAIRLYYLLGFKPEQYLPNFYTFIHPPGLDRCKHAWLMVKKKTG
ncbi:hypothetical protein P9112_006060 [Eukaryota sp. TZLM1-RC]